MSLKQNQIDHARALITAWETYGVYLDASDTGSGKSYVAAYICKTVGLRPVIICPLGAITQWFDIMAHFDVQPIAVSNYEQIKETRAKETRDGPMVDVPWLQKQPYIWKLPHNSCVIFDECHRGKNEKTGISELLISLRAAVISNTRVGLLSATPADTLTTFWPVGAVLGITQKDHAAYRNWIKRRKNPQQDIIDMLYSSNPPRASKMTLQILQQQKVDTKLIVLPPDIKKVAVELIEELDSAASQTRLGDIQRCRQELEILKAPFVAEEAASAYENGYRPVIFTNFDRSREIIYTIMVDKIYKVTGRPPVQLYGGQTTAEREQVIDMFRKRNAPAIIISMAVGGSAISLHSTEAGRPPALFLMPTWSGIDIKQALGRCAREGAADVPLAWIVYTDCSLEKHIYERMNDKLKYINTQ